MNTVPKTFLNKLHQGPLEVDDNFAYHEEVLFFVGMVQDLKRIMYDIIVGMSMSIIKMTTMCVVCLSQSGDTLQSMHIIVYAKCIHVSITHKAHRITNQD